MKKTMTGTIISLKTAETASVLVESKLRHPLYKKFVKSTKKYACHYQNMQLELGDRVTIAETAPISKTKKFRIVNKVEVAS